MSIYEKMKKRIAIVSTKNACCSLYKNQNGECLLDCPLCIRRTEVERPCLGDVPVGCVADKWSEDLAYAYIMGRIDA